MYASFFGFKENPFNLTPDPRYLYLSHYHKEALDHLLYGVNERKGFIAITGGIGTGKTTLCRAFLDQLDKSVKSALIFDSYISDLELLKAVDLEFGIDMKPGDLSKKDYIDALNHFLLDNFSKGGNALLLVDEAQNLSHSVLEQMRMLSNLETEREKLIQIILVGQPELKEVLAAPSLKQLDERITVRYNLSPLDYKDLKGYVEHRLVVAGNRGELKFSKNALKKIFAYSQGNPRRINAVCDRALLIAYAQEKHTVTRQMIQKAIEEIRGGTISGRTAGIFYKKGLGQAFFLILIIAAGLAGWTQRTNISQMFIKEPEVKTIIRTIHVPRRPTEPEKKVSNLFLDEQASLASLFNLINGGKKPKDLLTGEIHLDLVSLEVGPEYSMRFTRPYRIQLTRDLPHTLYLLVSKQTGNSCTIIDSEGKEQDVSKNFIQRNWGHYISWFFPYTDSDIDLKKGMSSPKVLEVQMILQKNGYQVKASGIFDELTLNEIKRLQKDFGLIADGIIGPKTRALLYLMG
ncbi:putative secretion ATPase, PEP-CTERM locus family protein [uncultured Desulfobacterium sp.]|uniref:Putative secretion ATPase, PEP-CTERM locus family protein n=1 Tax=uncultured Desulfobacterium sp. TaxID=201089 RepID=A0A445MSN8_9BACT|nr:putative secretion ATPase, PEP-CTERM locus family protein [uncultured Desulfobacterium sp.]